MQPVINPPEDSPPVEEKDSALKALQTTFRAKYDEELSTEFVTPLITQYGIERVHHVIDCMKEDAYSPASFLRRSLNSGWYQNKREQKSTWTEGNGTGKGKSESEATTRELWKMKMEFGLCTKEERDYMLSVEFNGTKPSEERVREITFGILQKMYPTIPSRWFYWLKQSSARQAANDWIANSGRSDLPLYEIF